MNIAFRLDDGRPRHHVVVHHPEGYGCAIAGSLTPDDLAEVMRGLGESHGYDLANCTIPALISRDCVMVLGTREGIQAWEAQLDAEAERQHPADPVAAWMHSTRPGRSSMWMVSTLAGKPVPEHWRKDGYTDPEGWPEPAFPDSADAFRCCVDALRSLFRRDDLGCLAEGLSGYTTIGHRWLNLLPRWDELVGLLDAERWEPLSREIDAIGRLNPFGPREVLVRMRFPDGGEATTPLRSLVAMQYQAVMDSWIEAGKPDPAPRREDIEQAVRSAVAATPGWEVEP